VRRPDLRERAAERTAQQRRTYFRQVLASIAAAIVIVAVTVAIVSAQLPLDRLPPEQEDGRRDRTEDSGSGRGGGN
jgi:hypothetical protein